MRGLVRFAACGLTVLLSGCLVSEVSLFSASRLATPLAEGEYEACSLSANGETSDCGSMSVSRQGDAYVFNVEDDVLTARFVDVGENNFAVELTETGDREFMYYWGHQEDGALSLALVWCEDLPRALVDQLAADGGLEPAKDYSSCKVRSLDSVVAAVRSYSSGETTTDSRVIMKPIPPQ